MCWWGVAHQQGSILHLAAATSTRRDLHVAEQGALVLTAYMCLHLSLHTLVCRSRFRRIVALRSNQIGSRICTHAAHAFASPFLEGGAVVGQQRDGYGALCLTLAYTTA